MCAFIFNILMRRRRHADPLRRQGRAGVPCTGMVRLTHSTLLRGGAAEVQLKAGSLQRFVPHDCTSEDVGTALFDTEQVAR